MLNSTPFPSWAPPPDPQKPDCPYQPGFTVEIKSHVAPEPFGHRFYAAAPRTKESTEDLKKLTQTALVLKYPPSENVTALTPNPVRGRLTVTDFIAIGNSRGAQLVACDLDLPASESAGAKQPVTVRVVAKIFDALYYSFAHTEFPTKPVDTSFVADMDYSREVAAYEYMRDNCPDMLGGFAPAYHGSWTFELPIRAGAKILQRPVRLVLLEHLRGRSMKELYTTNTSGINAALDALHIREDWRLEVLRLLFVGIMKQRHAGIEQRALAPRNIYLVPPPGQPTLIPGGPTPRVVLFDYNVSIVMAKTKVEIQAAKLPKPTKPRNPMEVYWTEYLPELHGWIPNEWYQDPKLRQQWLVRQFGGEKAVNFASVTQELDCAV